MEEEQFHLQSSLRERDPPKQLPPFSQNDPRPEPQPASIDRGVSKIVSLSGCFGIHGIKYMYGCMYIDVYTIYIYIYKYKHVYILYL